jgi:hypothetical protein
VIFVLQQLTRVEKKATRKAERENNRFDNLLDVGHVGDLEALSGMSHKRGFHDNGDGGNRSASKGRGGREDSYGDDSEGYRGAKAMRRSLSAFRK